MTESATTSIQYNNTKPISVVLIPDYLAKTLPAVGITFEQLDKTTSFGDTNSFNFLNKMFTERVSKADIKDLLVANYLLRDMIMPNIDGDSYNDRGVFRYIVNELRYAAELYSIYPFQDFIFTYSNADVDINTIIVSEDDIHKQVFEFRVTDNTVFVILHSGFTNFLVHNSIDFKQYFLSKLMDCTFNAFGEESVYQTTFFKSFIRQ